MTAHTVCTLEKEIRPSNFSVFLFLRYLKGQTISKTNYGVPNSSKKRTKYHYPEYFLKRRY